MPGIDSFTKFCAHFDGSDASTTFADSSASAHAISPVGNAQVDTAQSKFGGASLLLDGTGDYLTAPSSADFNMGATGDWVIDCWLRMPDVASEQVLWSMLNGAGGAGTNGANVWILDGELNFDNGVAGSAVSGGSLNADTWYHVAVIRSGSTVYLALDGTIVSSDTAQTYHNANCVLHVGAWHSANPLALEGWIDELRISKGTDRGWSGGFTPPVAAYSAGVPRSQVAIIS